MPATGFAWTTGLACVVNAAVVMPLTTLAAQRATFFASAAAPVGPFAGDYDALLDDWIAQENSSTKVSKTDLPFYVLAVQFAPTSNLSSVNTSLALLHPATMSYWRHEFCPTYTVRTCFVHVCVANTCTHTSLSLRTFAFFSLHGDANIAPFCDMFCKISCVICLLWF